MPVALHPDPARLTAFARGALPPDDLASVADHVADCPSCCDALARASGDSLAELARAAAGGVPDAARTPSLSPDPPHHSTQANTVGASAPTPLPRLPVSPEVALADHPRYKILAELGAGGMGVVYKAEHRLMGRVVALKVVSPHLTAKKNTVERFRREVQAAAKLSHANIVAAHDAEEAAGLHFLVMEYVDGISLDRLVAKKGALPVAMACQFIRHAAQGLQHASDQGMVHRDIKPQNIMVTRRGQVKVLDFGLARFARSAPEGEAVTEVGGAALPQDAGLTQPNHVMGTPDYLSPEQARSSAVDIRSDIYSLGCTLYFLLAGRVPFPDGVSLFDKLIAHTNDTATPIQSLRPDVPDGLARVLARMMAKKADDRFQTPAEVAAALHPYAKGLDTKGAKPAAADEVVEAVLVAPSPTAGPAPAESPFREFVEVAAETPSELEAPPPTVSVRRPRRGYRRRRRESNAWKVWVALGVGFLGLLAIALGVRAVMKPKPIAEATGRATETEPDRRPARPTNPATRPTPPPPTTPDPGPTQPENPFRPGVPVSPMPRDPQTPDLSQRVLLVVLPSDDPAPDFTPLRQRLTEMGAKVETATGKGTMLAPGAAFLETEATYRLRPGMDYTRFAAVVFCGTTPTDEYALPPPGGPKGGFPKKKDAGGPKGKPPQVEAAGEAVYHAMTQKKPLAALGAGGARVLDAHGALAGRKVPALLNLSSARPTEPKSVVASVVEDRPVIVGVGGSSEDTAAFADAVLKAMDKKK